MTNEGIVIRISLKNVSVYGRNTQGVKLISLDESQTVSTVAVVYKPEEDQDEENDSSPSAEKDSQAE